MKTVDETVSFVEAKEMARNAMSKPPVNATISGYKKGQHTKPKTVVSCEGCGTKIDKFVWNQRQGKMIEVSLCLSCWKKANPRKRASKDPSSSKDEAGALFIAPISVIPHLEKPTTALPSGEFVNSPPLDDSISPPIPDPDDV